MLRIGHDAIVGEFAHLLANRIERVVEPAGADRRVVMLPDQLDQAGAARRRVAGGDEMLDGGRHARGDRRRRQPEIGQPHDLALAHRDAAEDLGQIFAGADTDDQILGLAEGPTIGEPLGIGGKLPDGLQIGGKPGEPVGGALFAIEDTPHRAALDRDAIGDGAAGVGEQRLDGRDSVGKRGNDLVALSSLRGGKRHDWLR